MTTYELLSWGANSHDQLGHGIKSEQSMIPKAVNLKIKQLHKDLRISDIKKITGGAGHSLILTVKGEVYSCGLNSKGQAGRRPSSNNENSLLFEKIEGELRNEVIVDIAAGWDSSMAINNQGNLFAWGSNSYGQLGVNIKSDDCNIIPCSYTPEKVDLDQILSDPNDKVVNISMGLRHSVIVTDNGKVFVTGSGNKCQLGLIDRTNNPVKKTTKFIQVPGLNGIKLSACGQHHTIVLTKEGDLFGWGDNKHGQLGFDVDKYPIIETPLKLENINVGSNAKIYTGWTHTAVLNDGKILAWGRNSYGQLGHDNDKRVNRPSENWVPKLVKNIPKSVNQLAVGSEHNIALAEDGSMLCWGWNEHGNCGTGTDEDIKLPTIIKTEKNVIGKLVGTGYGHSFAVVVKRNESLIEK